MRRALPLLVLLLGACAASPGGRAAAQVVGVVVLTGTEQPIVGATIVVTARPPEGAPLQARLRTGELGAFAVSELPDASGALQRLARGWEIEVQAEANGFFGGSDRFVFPGGQHLIVLEIDPIDDGAMAGVHLVGEQRPDRLRDVEGTLIKEVLRRMGQAPPGSR